MNRQILYKLFILTCFLYSHYAYSQHSVTIAKDHFDKFNNVKNGWLAADATISLLLPDGKTLWLFGDTFIGEKSGKYSILGGSATFINNCAVIEDDTSLTAYYGGTIESPSSLIPKDGLDIFWPEHAVFEKDTINIFAVKVILEEGEGPFSFHTERTYIARFTYPEMQYIDTKAVPSLPDSTMRFGTHVLKREDYVYIFGKKDTTAGGFTYPVPMLARVDSSVSEPWEFYAGSGSWSYNSQDAVSIGDRPMAESFFVHEKEGKFYLIMHEIWTVGELYILEADAITGPFNRAGSGGIENKFCIIPAPGDNFTYNLFAHPHIENEGKFLISFNVNTYDFWSIFSDTRNYRARFLWLSVDDAVSATIPDTVNILDDYFDVSVPDFNDPTIDIIRYFHGNVSLKNIKEPGILNIYSPEGKLHRKIRVYSDKTINISDLPNNIYIIQFINKDTVATKKIFHCY